MEADLLHGKSRNEQIGTIWKYLDELALNDPEKYSEFIKTTLEDGAKEGLGPPLSKFVIRTQKIPRMIPVRDFFINACQWVQIPGPKTSSEPIKMIASDLREELIQNRMCFTVDVAVNDGVMEQCLGSQDEKSMLIDLMIRYVEATNNCNLDTNYTIADQDYMGNRDNLLDMMCPVSLREAAKESSSGFSEEKLIRGLKKMTTEDDARSEAGLNVGNCGGARGQSNDILLPNHVHASNETFLCESNKEESKHDTKMENSGSKYSARLEDPDNVEGCGSIKDVDLKEPLYVRRSEVNGRDTFEVIEVDLPGVANMNDCDLDVGQDFLSLEVPQKFALKLSLNSRVDEDHTKAYFVRKDEKLVIRVKFLSG